MDRQVVLPGLCVCRDAAELVPTPGFRQDVEHVMLWSILDFMFIMQRYRVEIAVFDHLRLDSCLAVASRIAGEIDLLADNGELEIMQDTASCMTSSMVVFLRKVRFSRYR